MLTKIVRLFAAAIFTSLILPIQSAKAAEPVWCGQENSTCYPASGVLNDAYYCGGGKCAHRVVNGPFSCNNATFGDPAYNTVKNCYVGEGKYTYRQPEFNNPTSAWGISEAEPIIVAFGSMQSQNWAARVLGEANCDTNSFGDPAFGLVKACYSGPKFTFCANENGTCNVNGGLYGITLVAYGPYSGPFTYKVVTGSITCNNANFGDPAPNQVKKCFVKPM